VPHGLGLQQQLAGAFLMRRSSTATPLRLPCWRHTRASLLCGHLRVVLQGPVQVSWCGRLVLLGAVAAR
jgi:hypothetical protein